MSLTLPWRPPAVDEIEVRLMEAYNRTDEDLANAARNPVEWNFSVPRVVKVSVDHGWITLRGETEWDYQRQAAEKAVGHLMGVRGIKNEMTLRENARADQQITQVSTGILRE